MRQWHWTEIVGLIAVRYAHEKWMRSCGLAGVRTNLAGVYLKDVPSVPGLDARILAAVESGEGKLDMLNWHGPEDDACGTTHCRAGWAVCLAGEDGRALESRVGPAAAGALIYAKSVGYVPNFYASDGDALKDIRERAKEQV